MANNQELRQGLNVIEIVGAVKESKLGKGSNDKGNYINGSFIVKAGEFTDIEVNVFVNEKNKKGDVKKVYQTLKAIMNKEYKTMADGVSEEDTTKVRIWGNGDFTPHFSENLYVSKQDGEIKSIIKIDLGFGNVTVNDKVTSEDYKAKFDVEVYVDKVKDEMELVNGMQQNTGRLIIEGWTPVYGGSVIPLNIVAGVIEDEEGTFDFASQLKGAIYQGMTLNLWGNINYQQIIEEVKKGGGLGRAKTETKKKYIHDLVAIGGDIISDMNKIFDMELIKQARVERENKKQEVLQKSNEKSNKGKGLGSGFATDSSIKKPMVSPF